MELRSRLLTQQELEDLACDSLRRVAHTVAAGDAERASGSALVSLDEVLVVRPEAIIGGEAERKLGTLVLLDTVLQESETGE